MDLRARPYRSVLYIPGSKERALEKARAMPIDAIIFDLEDAVAPSEKPAARAILAEALTRSYGNRTRIVRINGFDTEWGKADAKAAAAMDCDAILLPKVESTAQLDALAELTDKPLWAMMETPGAMLNAAAIAAPPLPITATCSAASSSSRFASPPSRSCALFSRSLGCSGASASCAR